MSGVVPWGRSITVQTDVNQSREVRHIKSEMIVEIETEYPFAVLYDQVKIIPQLLFWQFSLKLVSFLKDILTEEGQITH